MLNDLSGITVAVFETIIPQTEWSPVTDQLLSKILIHDKPDFPSFLDIEYKIPTALTEDGTLEIKFRIKNKISENWEQEKDVNIEVEGILASIVYEYLTKTLVQKTFTTFPFEASYPNIDSILNDDVVKKLFIDPNGNSIKLPNSVKLHYGVLERNIPGFKTSWLVKIFSESNLGLLQWKNDIIFESE